MTLILLLLLGLGLWTPDLDRATLEARYLQAPADLVQVAGTTLHVRDSGPRDAPALLLVHGFGSSLQTWDDWLPALAAGHRVLRFDLPGSGLSPPDSSGDYSDARSVALMLALMDQLGLARATVVGHSIGGRIAWTFAARHPGRVHKLVLLAPDGFASQGPVEGSAPALPPGLGLLRHVLPRPLLQLALAPAYADPATLSDALVTRYQQLLRAPGARSALLERAAQTRRVDPRPLLRSIAAPTLLLWGAQDRLIPLALSADFLQALPDARRVVLPGVGHLPQEELPALGLAALLEFLG